MKKMALYLEQLLHNADDEISNFVELSKFGSKKQIENKIKDLEKQMHQAAKVFDFEKAAELRDIILEMRANIK